MGCKRCDGTTQEADLAEDHPPPPPLEMKGRVYASCVRSSIIYGSEAMLLLTNVGLIFQRAEMQMIRWMCGTCMKYW